MTIYMAISTWPSAGTCSLFMMKVYSGIKKNEIELLAKKIDGSGNQPVKQNKPDSEKQKKITCSLICKIILSVY